MGKHVWYIILSLLFWHHAHLHAVVKGSTTSVSIEPSFQFPATDTDNAIQGFAWFKSGFTLENQQTALDFASVYPVSGTIDLRGGTLNLQEDLIFKNQTELRNLGTIVGNNYVLEFCSSITQLPAPAHTFDSVFINLSNEMTVQGLVTFSGSTVIDGKGNTVYLGDNAALRIASNSTLHLKNMTIKGIAGENIACNDDSGSLVLENCEWEQVGDVSFAHGALYIQDDVGFNGDYAFNFTSKQSITIGTQSTWSLFESIDLHFGRGVGPEAREPILFTDASSVLLLSNCSLFVTEGGVHLTKGRLILDEEVEIDMQSTNTSNGLIIGDGINPDNDFIIRFNASAMVTHAGHTAYNNVNPNKLIALSKNATIIREENSNIFMAQSIIMPSMSFESVSNLVQPIQCASDATIVYQNDQIGFPAVSFDFTGLQNQANTFCLTGDSEIFFTKGSLPLNLHVSGKNNLMHGNGGISGLLSLQDAQTELICSVLGPVSMSPVLHGGKLTFEGDFVLSPDVVIIGSGTIDLNACSLTCGVKDLLWTSSLTFEGTNGSIEIQGQVALQSTWEINGQVTIDGNNNTFDISKGSIIIHPGASLKCKNMRLFGLNGTNIRCVDDTGSLQLEDVVWMQTGDFNFAHGSLAINDSVDFLGSFTFSYTSKQMSTIAMQSQWHISDNMRFEIGKNVQGGTWPLSFEDETSALHLDNCSYVITGSGMQIIKGTIMYSRNVDVEILSTNTTNGSFLGNGVAADDPIVQFNPGAAANFIGGHLVWDVVDTTKLRSDTTTVGISRSAGNTYYIKQNLTLKNFTVTSDASVVTFFAPDKNLSYDSCLFKLPNGQIEISGSRYNAYTNLLSNGDSIFLHYGTLPLVTYVVGTGNRLEGNGIITGPVALLSPQSSLHCNVAGTLQADMFLNGGTVTLEGGLVLSNAAIIATGGSMNLGVYPLDLPATPTTWPSTISWGGADATINLNSSTTLTGEWIFTGNYTIRGNNNVLDLSAGGKIIVQKGVTLTFSDVRINGIDTNSIVMVDDSSALVLDNTSWVQKDNVLFDTGSLRIVDEVDFIGSSTFYYDSAMTTTIAVKSIWQITDGMRLSIGRKAQNTQDPLYFEDATSTLAFDNCIFHVTPFGLPLSRGKVLCSRDVFIDVTSTDTTNGIQLGDGTSAGDLVFEFYPGCAVNFATGHIVYDVTRPNSVMSRSTTSKLIRGATNHFYIKQNVLLSNLTIDASLYSTTNVLDGKTFSYENCEFVLPIGNVVINGSRYNSYTNILKNGDSLFLTSGLMPMVTLAVGAGNAIYGNGSLTGPVMLLSPTSDITLAIDGLVNKDITLNGGTLKLGQDTHFASGAIINDSGTVNLNNCRLQLTSQDTEWPGTITWQSSDAIISLQADTIHAGHWRFEGDCIIQGNGNVIDLRPGGNIEIAPGSSLKLANVRILGVSGTNIRCVDDSASLILDQVVWAQSGDVSFDHGSITIIDEVDFLGSYTFAYRSSQSSTIINQSTWHITDTMRFMLGKQPGEQNPLLFADQTATLYLDNCNMVITDDGWDLLKGCIRYTRNVDIEVLSTSTLNGVSLGDGIAEHDPLVFFDPGCNAHFKTGHLIYNIVNPANLRSDTTSVQMTRDADSFFLIKQNIVLKNFTVNASAYATTIVEDGIQFNYADCLFVLPSGRAQITASRYNAVSNLMKDNDIILMRYGALPMATLVVGQNTMIAGAGDITGPIIFLSPLASLSCGLSGSMQSNIMLNGGTFTANNDIKFTQNNQIAGDGIVDVQANRLIFGPQETAWSGNLLWQSDGGSLEFNNNVSLSTTWTFSGSYCLLDGGGNIVDLSEGGQLCIADTSVLHIKNAQIKGISATNIQCLTNNGQLILENVSWIQSGDFEFNKGSISWLRSNYLQGDATFAYTTNRASTINDRSCLVLDKGFIFKYDPQLTKIEDLLHLIVFENESSMLQLNNATLYAVPGITLLNGALVIEHNAQLLSDASAGITLGSGLTDQDCALIINNGVQLTIGQGTLNYRNSDPASWQSGNNLSNVYFADTTVLNLYEDVYVRVGSLIFGSHTALNRALGKDIYGSISVQGELSFGQL